MTTLKEFVKYFYVSIILLIIYIPLFFMAIFSFNATSDKGTLNFSWNGFSFKGWTDLFSNELLFAFANSIILGTVTSLIVIVLSLITVYSVWKQKNKTLNLIKNTTNNISIINPDIIIGASLATFFSFGGLALLGPSDEGFVRAVFGHAVMTLPYGILIMYPKSEKFNKSIFEASCDLGYSKLKTWFKTYFVYMLPSIFFTFLVSMVFSFDDFIITSITSNTITVGTELYQGKFQSWALALGTIILFVIIFGNAIFYFKEKRKAILLKDKKNKRGKHEKN